MIKFENEDIYQGEFQNGFAHGKGNYTWTNGEFFEGEYKQNVQVNF